jgi:hypothetical protein
MATVSPTITDISGNGTILMFTWALTTANTTGDPIPFAALADRSVTFSGAAAWGAATAMVEGSNDGSVYLPFADPQGNAISKTADAIESVLELTRYFRPRLSTAGTAAAVTVTLIAKSAGKVTK